MSVPNPSRVELKPGRAKGMANWPRRMAAAMALFAAVTGGEAGALDVGPGASSTGAVRLWTRPPSDPPTGERPGFDQRRPPPARTLQDLQGSLYSIGEPTDDEQYYVELINRARRDPPAEGQRLAATDDPNVRSAYEFFNVDLELVMAQFAGIAPAPPLSINARLTEAARRHSADMFENAFQSHTGSDGSSAQQRISATGYPWALFGENVFASAEDPWFGHAGFNVDWGIGPGGMQNPPGHRISIHNPVYREIGVGVVNGRNGDVGPQIVTQEFATQQNATPFITGVAYLDLNSNNFYDPGEGIGGIQVTVEGVSAYAVTARSGGYSVPVPGNGVYAVTFTAAGSQPVTETVTVVNEENVKLDFTPEYNPPTVSGSAVALVGRESEYTISPVGGATRYEWRVAKRAVWDEAEGAEGGLGRFEADVSGYSAISTQVRRTGSASFHLAHAEPKDQFLTLAAPVRLGLESSLIFWSRMGWATPTQVARAQISRDGGSTWIDLWTQTGLDGRGEPTFSEREVSLAGYAGESVLIRFAYTLDAGRYYPGADDELGWHIDDVLLTEILEGEEIEEVNGQMRFTLTPETVGEYVLDARAFIGDRALPWGPLKQVTAQEGGAGPSRVELQELARDAGGDWLLEFSVEGGGEAPIAEVQRADSVTGEWAPVATATFEPMGEGSYRARIPQDGASQAFFRILAR